MALRGAIPVAFGAVFPHGAFAVDVPEQQIDFSTKQPVKDKETGLPVWLVDIYDADPDVKGKQRQVKVKVLAEICPTLPDPMPGPVPFRPVEFTQMTVTPWVEELGRDDSGRVRTRVQYSLRARGVQAPGSGAKAPAPTSGAAPRVAAKDAA